MSNDINKIFKIIEKNDSLFLSNYSNDLMKVYSKDIAKYKNEIIALFGSGLSPYSLSSMCDNQELYELYINHIYMSIVLKKQFPIYLYFFYNSFFVCH